MAARSSPSSYQIPFLRAATTVADHIRREVMSKELMKRSTGEKLGHVTISIGVATLHKDEADPEVASTNTAAQVS